MRQQNKRTLKPKNVVVLVERPFKNFETGKIEIRRVVKDVGDCRPKERGWCPECLEAVRVHDKDHYEHVSRAGALCSFKTRPA